MLTTAFSGHFQPNPAREFLYRLHELQIRIVHQEPDGGAVGAAAETVEKLLVGDDGERGRPFVVERAAGLEFLAGALEGNVVLDDLHDVRPGDDIVDE